MKNRSHRYNINISWPRDEHKYTKYKKCLSMMIFICVKRQLSTV